MYLSVSDFKREMDRVTQRFSHLASPIFLPHRTHEGRRCQAVKIADGSGPGRVGVYFVGGIHGNEMMPPDALIHFMNILVNAYQNNEGITINENEFTAEQIQTIVSQLDIFVFPLANPDGRHFSATEEERPKWRKNRRNNGDGTFGVDINRNFDFLWDFNNYLSPTARRNSSEQTDNSRYIGPSAASEPETKNVVQILDDNPNISFFIDIHSSGQLILYDWGIDEVQTTNPDMNFRNTEFHGQMGAEGDSYKEYVNPADTLLRVNLGISMRMAILKVRGKSYIVQRAVDLAPTTGTSQDYVNSRCYVNPFLRKVHGFTLETGDGFAPASPEREAVIDEISAALIQFCIEIVQLPSDIFIRDNLKDTGEEPLADGGLSRSPDINHFRQELVNPQEALGNMITRFEDHHFESLEEGQGNFIYTRLQNRGYQKDDAEIDIYWTMPSTLPTPNSWNLIGTLSANDILPGEFRVVGPLRWNNAPAIGHYCFVGVIGTTTEDKPDLSRIRSLDDFRNLIRESNNVTWKNFDVEDIFAGSLINFSFLIQGWRRTSLKSDLSLDLTDLPEGTEVELKILNRLTKQATFEHIQVKRTSTKYHFLAVKPSRISRIKNMELKSSDIIQASLKIILPEDTPDGAFDLAVIQKIGGFEMGRITRRLNVGRFPFVANRRTKEVHRKNCPWVSKMSSKNKIAFSQLDRAIKRGYDGCHTCLIEKDHG